MPHHHSINCLERAAAVVICNVTGRAVTTGAKKSPKTRESCDRLLRKIADQRSVAARKAITPAGNARYAKLDREHARLQKLYWTLPHASNPKLRNPSLA
jgi:Holliday junction resolvasome RuvABC ATP-dependent DNA helicase subunit